MSHDHPFAHPDNVSTQRLYFLDWLRIAAFAVLIGYHVGMYYVSWDFHVKSPFAGPALEPWMMLSAPWRLPLLFIVSGAATSFMLRPGASASLLRSRSHRLLLPLVCGVVLVVPPQSYFEVVQKFSYEGSYVDFLGLYFSHYRGFCASTHCLILPTWNHLWFLPYLWAYTVLLWLVSKQWPEALDVLAVHAARHLIGLRLWLLPVVAITCVRIALFERFPSTHALFGDWFNHAMYFGMFVVGAVFARMPYIWDELQRQRWPALIAALACWATVVLHHDGGAGPLLQAVIVATLQWGALMAALGFARRHLNLDHPLRQRFTEAVFPVYILHQTLIIGLTQALAPLHWRPLIEGPTLVIMTFVLSYAGYEAVRRNRLLRPWFGLGRRPFMLRKVDRTAS